MKGWLVFYLLLLDLSYAETERKCEVKENNIFYPCKLPSDVFQVTKATLSPEIIKSGEYLYITVWGNLTEEVKDGHWKVTTSIGPVGYNLVDQALSSERFDTPLSFPLKPGPIKVKRRFIVPKLAPPLTYKVLAKAQTDTGKSLFELLSNLKISF